MKLKASILAALLTLASVQLYAVVIGSDTFTDTAGTNLTAHTANVGGAWAKVTGPTGNFVISDANRARLDSIASGAVYYHAPTAATAEYNAKVTFYNATTIAGNYYGLFANLLTTAITGYQVQYEVDAGQFVLNEVTNDVYTPISSPYVVSLADATPYVVELQVRTGSQAVYIDTVLRISGTDTTHTSIGKCGLSSYASTTTPTNTTGVHFDDFSCTDLSSAATGTRNGLFLRGVSQ